jgi:DNA invertase Pin-like site-specific DNA recombinase
MIRTDGDISLDRSTLFIPPKIQPRHLERLAVVYVRQSTAQQVLEHRESTALQYDLKHRAISWGWSEERVLVIDEDQGHSGSSAEGRMGFQRLLSEVSLDHVGLVLGIEMSRLARSCKDWHQLLEICAIFGSLLADQDGLYDPQEYNDRLLLGLKGTLSEAELHILRQRMYQGRLNKAKRGELFSHPPIGYIRYPAGSLALDPDQQVQAVVHLIFEQFQRLGTINALLKYMVQNQIELPVRPHQGTNRGQLEWHRPNRQSLRDILHHPIYAGAYTFGRRRVDPRRKVPGKSGTGRTVVPPEECLVFLKDRCPAYITWQDYQAHQKQIVENQARQESRGPVREGSALLQGLMVCGRCGRRMQVQYDPSCRSRYVCSRRTVDYGEPLCQSVSGECIDALVTRQVLLALEPAALELSLSTAEDIQRQRTVIDRQWQQRVERATYESERAHRQYQAVEPENRLVARELEKQWEQKLLERRDLEDQYDRFRSEQLPTLSGQEREMIQNLSQDIPELWHSTETSTADRRTILRQLIGKIVVTVSGTNQHVDLTLYWAGGFTSQHSLIRPVAKYEQLDNYSDLMDRILKLQQQGNTSARIAEILNKEGFRPPKRRTTYNAGMIRQLLHRRIQGIHQYKGDETLAPQEYEWWLSDLVRRLQIPHPTLYNWIQRGFVHARQLPGRAGPWIIWADDEELERLKQLHRCSRNWVNQPQAAELTQPKPKPLIE